MTGLPWTGGCACGRLSYRVSGEPVAMLDCQCRQCQRESGTGHASHITFVGSAVELTGDASLYDQTGDGGMLKRRAFCPNCGAPVYMTFPAAPEVFVLRAASLDAPERYKPGFVTWTAAGQDWDHLPPGLTRFERMPTP